MTFGPFLVNGWALLYAGASTVLLVEVYRLIRWASPPYPIRTPKKLRAGLSNPNSWKESR